jgi:ribonuclease R
MKPSPKEDARTQARILKTLRKRKQRPLHASEIRGRIGLDRSRHDEVMRVLGQMSDQGLVERFPGDRFQFREPERPSASEPAPENGAGRRRGKGGGTLEGVLSMNARGFGFVVTGEGPDVFIPPGYFGAAMHGDKVRVKARQGAKGLDGRITEVLERAIRFVGGQLHVSAHDAWIEPDDERLRMPIRIKGKLPAGARTGQGVIAKVLSYPEKDGEPLEVKVVETFEPEAFVQYEIKRILLREGASEEFPADVMAEAAELPHAIAARDRRGREDLRDTPLLTIDPADARDHDDAVWAERLPDQGFRVIVAIADVSHYVREHSALDREALERGCTIYLPSRAIPMLPPALSSNLASLLPRRDRLTLAVEIELDHNGHVQRHRFVEGVMRSAANLTYEQVAQALGLTVQPDAAQQNPAQAHLPELNVLLEVAKVLRERRRARGSLEFELPEAKVRVDDETGHPIDVERSRKDPGVARAYGMIEELMLLANEVVAQDLTERGLPTMYRVHPAPDPERIETFCALAKALGFDIAADVAEHPKKLARFLAGIHGTPHAQALGYLLLRSMQQATYDTENVGHFGLAAEHYLHFTSPIRRYPDLAVHRVVRAVARGERVESWGLGQRLKLQAGQSSQRERRAMAIEREVVDLYGAYLMRDQVGETFDATISGLSDHGFYATLDKPFVDVLCRTASLPIDRYELDAHGVRLRGLTRGRSYALGDRVRLRILDVSLAQRKVLAAPAEVATLRPEERDEPPTRPLRRREPGDGRGGAGDRSGQKPRRKREGQRLRGRKGKAGRARR